MTKRESWITEKKHLKINYSVILLYILIHIEFVLSIILIVYLTMGFGKTTFSTKHLMIVSDQNLNIAIIEIFCFIFGMSLADWFINDFTQKFLVYIESEEQIDIFSEEKRLVFGKKHPFDLRKQSSEYIKTKFHTKKRFIRNFFRIIIALLILEPVLLFASISIADTMLKTNPQYLSTQPTFFIASFFGLYIISDYFFLIDIIPTLRIENKIDLLPKLIFFIIVIGISCLAVYFSVINYGLF